LLKSGPKTDKSAPMVWGI